MANRKTIAASRSCRAAAFLLIGAGLCAAPARAAAQEFGLDITAGRTDLAQLETPIGLGARLAVYPLPFLGFELAYMHVLSRSRFAGMTCTSPFGPCTTETVETRTSVGSAGVSALAGFSLGSFRVQAGIGLSQNLVREARLVGLETSWAGRAYFSEEGLQDIFRTPNGTQFFASVDHALGFGLPLRVRLAYERRRVDWRECWYGRVRRTCDSTDWQRIAIGTFYVRGASRTP